MIDAATSAALIAAGLLSVLLFPAAGLALLRSDQVAGVLEPARDPYA